MTARHGSRSVSRFLGATILCALGVAAAPRADSQGAPRPGSEFKGITTLGVVVEELNAQAQSCGLSQSVIQQAVSALLTDAGLKVVRNSDEDTYLYVNVNTLSVPGNLCVSRYDASLYTHTTTKLPYQDQPVLVEVSLAHQGGLSGGSVNGHAENIVKNLKLYVGQFVDRIKAANKTGSGL